MWQQLGCVSWLHNVGVQNSLLLVFVRNVPQISGNSISDSLDQFFKTSHPDTYLCHQ
ncbi:hypothetical protein Golax_024648 [Gossypium laxum]|uniref:Uncharacterized protein n=1 Tax=Gossypium laxum TaxID=34288 RepID=A0A7J8ZDG3_9ROSI|nr:hypothetical protein [Gossypium laxum]